VYDQWQARLPAGRLERPDMVAGGQGLAGHEAAGRAGCPEDEQLHDSLLQVSYLSRMTVLPGG